MTAAHSHHHEHADNDRGHDEHDHAHEEHAHEHAGIRGVLGYMFRPHSHDSSDSIDTALEETDRGIRAVKISFAALILTSLLQLAVVVLTSSIALLADTIHNFSDALTAVPLFLAF